MSTIDRPLCSFINVIGNNVGNVCSVYAGLNCTNCFYHTQDASINDDTICPICHEVNPDFQISCCRNWFHKECLEKLQKSNILKCPMCRRPTNIERTSDQYICHNFIIKALRVDDGMEEIEKVEKNITDTVKEKLQIATTNYHPTLKRLKFNYENDVRQVEKAYEKIKKSETVENYKKQYNNTLQKIEKVKSMSIDVNDDIVLAKKGLKIIDDIKKNNIMFPNYIRPVPKPKRRYYDYYDSD